MFLFHYQSHYQSRQSLLHERLHNLHNSVFRDIGWLVGCLFVQEVPYGTKCARRLGLAEEEPVCKYAVRTTGKPQVTLTALITSTTTDFGTNLSLQGGLEHRRGKPEDSTPGALSIRQRRPLSDRFSLPWVERPPRDSRILFRSQHTEKYFRSRHIRRS